MRRSSIFFLSCTSIFLATVFGLSTPVFAGGTLRLLCDSEKIDKSLKDYYPACASNGSALPGDVVLLEGSGYTISTKQSPVVIDQSTALVSGDRRIPIPRIYPMPPTSSSYATSNGEFRANIVVPVETPPGDYDISFKVTQRACNYSKGVPCIVDIARARLTVLPTVSSGDIKAICDKGENGAPSASVCQKGSPLSLSAKPLPTRNRQPIYFYYKKNGQYSKTYEYLTTEKDHSVRRNTYLPSEPGEYTIVLRSTLLGVKMGPTDFEKIGPTLKVVVTAPPVAIPQPINPPPETQLVPITANPIVAGLQMAVNTDQEAYQIPSLPLEKPFALVSNARFTVMLFRYEGMNFREGHRMTLSLGTGANETFRNLTVLNDIIIGASAGGPTISKKGDTFAFGSVLSGSINGKPIPTGSYTLRAESMDDKTSPTYYRTDLTIAIEQLRPLKPKIKVPPQIKQGVPFVIQGSQFSRDAQITEVRFSADAEPIILPQHAIVKKDGTFAIAVTPPARTDAIIKYVVDENDKTDADFFWSPATKGRIFVGVKAKEKDGTIFDVTEKTMIPLLCPISAKPTVILTSPPIIDQSLLYSISFDVSGFICRDQLSVQFEGIRVKGKQLDPSQTKNFFAVMPSFASDANGEARNFGFGSGSGARTYIDSDVEKITMVVSDRHRRSARADIRVIARYSIVLKKKTKPNDGDAIIWKGFDVPGVRATLTLEDEKILGKDSPILLKSPYLDKNNVDEHGVPVIDFSVPSDLPPGSYTLRLQQGDAGATTTYIKEKGDTPLMETKRESPTETGITNPCKGLEGYMLKTCQAAYNVDIPSEESGEALEQIASDPCQGFEGYFLHQCQKVYGIQPPPPEQQQDAPLVSECQGLEGYMLRQCHIAYGISVEEQPPLSQDLPAGEVRYCDPELPSIWQQGCLKKQHDQTEDQKTEKQSDPIPAPTQEPSQEKQQQEVKYCNPELPKLWQKGCVNRPYEEVKKEEAPICNSQVPRYSQPNCREL